MPIAHDLELESDPYLDPIPISWARSGSRAQKPLKIFLVRNLARPALALKRLVQK